MPNVTREMAVKVTANASNLKAAMKDTRREVSETAVAIKSASKSGAKSFEEMVQAQIASRTRAMESAGSRSNVRDEVQRRMFGGPLRSTSYTAGEQAERDMIARSTREWRNAQRGITDWSEATASGSRSASSGMVLWAGSTGRLNDEHQKLEKTLTRVFGGKRFGKLGTLGEELGIGSAGSIGLVVAGTVLAGKAIGSLSEKMVEARKNGESMWRAIVTGADNFMGSWTGNAGRNFEELINGSEGANKMHQRKTEERDASAEAMETLMKIRRLFGTNRDENPFVATAQDINDKFNPAIKAATKAADTFYLDHNWVEWKKGEADVVALIRQKGDALRDVETLERRSKLAYRFDMKAAETSNDIRVFFSGLKNYEIPMILKEAKSLGKAEAEAISAGRLAAEAEAGDFRRGAYERYDALAESPAMRIKKQIQEMKDLGIDVNDPSTYNRVLSGFADQLKEPYKPYSLPPLQTGAAALDLERSGYGPGGRPGGPDQLSQKQLDELKENNQTLKDIRADLQNSVVPIFAF